MASSPNTINRKEWQNRYSADSYGWMDLRRMAAVILPILLLAFMAIMAAILYTRLHGSVWRENISTEWSIYWFKIRVFLTFLFPLFIAVFGIAFLFQSSIAFVEKFYNHPGEKKISLLVWRKLLGAPPLPPPVNTFLKYPSVTIKEPKDLAEDHWARWLGGPATLVVYDGVALYLERGNSFSRIVGPGRPFLDRFERVKAVVDLHPQERIDEIKRWTKDGIQIELKIRMEAQIFASEEARNASLNLVYPFDPIAVKQAVEYSAVGWHNEKRQLEEFNWLDGVWDQVIGYFSHFISRYSVDEIAQPENDEDDPNDGDLHPIKIAQQQLDEINVELKKRNCGANLLSLHVSAKFPAEVEQLRIDYWKSQRGKITAIRESKAEGDRIRVHEETRARVERDMLNAITERLKRVPPENLTEPLLFSLTSILDNSLDDPLVRPLIAKSSLDLLTKLRKVLKDRF